MEFWIGLFIFCLICIAIEWRLPKPINRIMPYVLLVTLWFISAFRHNIGNDYSQYVEYFYFTDIDDLYPEVIFRYLVVSLRDCGFDYQILFFIYSSVTYLILWLSIRKYINDTSTRMVAIVLYAITFSLMWYSFSTIRQSLSVVMFFYAMEYIESRNLSKYCLWLFLATLNHTSACLLIPLYWISREKQAFSRYVWILIVCVVLYYLKIFLVFTENFLGFIGMDSYIGYIVSETQYSLFRLSVLFEVFIFFVCLYYRRFIPSIFINVYAVYIYGMILFTFSTVSARMNLYFEISYIVCLAQIITRLSSEDKNKLSYCVLLPIFCILLQCMYSDANDQIVKLLSQPSTGNYQYEFNFKLIK